MKVRTSVILDTEILAEAERVLGTKRATKTIELALIEIVNREKRRRLAALEMPGLTPASLERSRAGRQFDIDDADDADDADYAS
jgi:Arc/MetJ family transcription regulator